MRILLLLPAALFVGGLAVLILVGQANSADAPVNPPRTVVIGVDLSSSNPLIRDDAFAAKVAGRVKPIIEGLSPHSRVVLRSFGAYNSSANAALSLDVLIAPKTARAEDIANVLATLIAGVPQMVRQGRLREQNATNIVPFLMNMASVVDCRTPTEVILASDGVEDSQVAKLKRRSATLPRPEPRFAGCEELMILGIGRGLDSPTDTERLRIEWQQWALAAGFRHFTGLNDW